MRSKVLAPLAVVAVAITAPSTSSAEETHASASASTSTGFTVSSSDASREGDPKKTVLPIVVGGLGVAQVATGIVLILAAPTFPSNCDEGTRTCMRTPGQSEQSFHQDQKDAGNAQQMNNYGVMAVASGGVFLVAGAAMWFWYNREPSKTASAKPVVMPYASTNGGGLAAVATF